MRLGEIAAGAAVVCLLLALLTWLLLRGISTDSEDYAATLRIFDEFALAEASLHRDVLQARAGFLQDYDPINDSMAEIDSTVARLRSKAFQDRLDVAPIDRLAAATGLGDELTERFKTDDALLRNSLSYVGLFSTNPDFVDRNPLLARPIGRWRRRSCSSRSIPRHSPVWPSRIASPSSRVRHRLRGLARKALRRSSRMAAFSSISFRPSTTPSSRCSPFRPRRLSRRRARCFLIVTRPPKHQRNVSASSSMQRRSCSWSRSSTSGGGCGPELSPCENARLSSI
jgi:DAHL domain